VPHSRVTDQRRALTGSVVCLALVAALAAAVDAGQQRPDRRGGTPRPITPRGPLAAEEQRTIDLFEQARGSVVYISTSERVFDPWTRNLFSMPRGTGSGFVWDERGQCRWRSSQVTTRLAGQRNGGDHHL
jgi:hypothetical protein